MTQKSKHRFFFQAQKKITDVKADEVVCFDVSVRDCCPRMLPHLP